VSLEDPQSNCDATELCPPRLVSNRSAILSLLGEISQLQMVPNLKVERLKLILPGVLWNQHSIHEVSFPKIHLRQTSDTKQPWFKRYVKAWLFEAISSCWRH